MTLPQGKDAEFDRVATAIESLCEADWLRLHKAARIQLWGTGFSDPQELINEALMRMLEGSRTWPSNVPFVVCAANAMRSIANGVRNLVERKEEILATDIDPGEYDNDADPLERFGDFRFAPESVLENEAVRQAAISDLADIEEYFKEDEQVGWILMGIEDDLSSSEIRTLSGMTQTQYETARKRLRRGLEKLSPRRRKS